MEAAYVSDALVFVGRIGVRPVMKNSCRILLLALLVLAGLIWPSGQSVAQGPRLQYGLGLLPSPAGDYPSARLAAVPTALPRVVDLSVDMPPVGNQGAQASCVGWAIAYYYRSFQEARESRLAPTTADRIFSPAFIYNQRRTAKCARDAGMSMVDGLRVAINLGVATYRTMPYYVGDTCTRPSHAALIEASSYRSQTYVNMFLGQGTANLTALKQHLASGDPFLLAVPIYSNFLLASSANPIIDVPQPGAEFYGGHAITVVGYDEGLQAFKFVNSWGQGWGDQGYGYLTYDFVQHKSWEAWALVNGDTTPPSLPQVARELGGVVSGVRQSEITRPVFVWEPSDDPAAVYRIYWGPDPEGTSERSSRQPLFVPEPVEDNAMLYLRVAAIDPVGNASEWRTLFVFCFEKQGDGGSPLVLQPMTGPAPRDPMPAGSGGPSSKAAGVRPHSRHIF
ncbi:MAG: C1 family peptidase [Chloroflexi bacterium]|nr:C1 family peptidase [Chloroflexota bacterium]